MNYGLSNHVALVTGGGAGIGAAIASRLADEGAMVYVSCLSNEAGVNVLAASREDGRIRPIRLDVTDDAQVQMVVGQIAEDAGDVQVVVNNAVASNWANFSLTIQISIAFEPCWRQSWLAA